MKKGNLLIYINLNFSLFLFILFSQVAFAGDAFNNKYDAQEYLNKTEFKKGEFAQLLNGKKKKRFYPIPANQFHIKSNLSFLEKNDIMNDLRNLVTESRPSRLVGSPGHKKAIEFILAKIKEYDLTQKGQVSVEEFVPDLQEAIKSYKGELDAVKKQFEKIDEAPRKSGIETAQKFTDLMVKNLKSFEGTVGKNIVWIKKGSTFPEQEFLVTAHFDSLSFEGAQPGKLSQKAPGADDNASGVAVLLNLIKLISLFDSPYTMRFVFLDWEEWGGLGSKILAEKLNKSKSKIMAQINLEMLGHDSRHSKDGKRGRFGDRNLIFTGLASEELAKEISTMGSKNESSLKVDLVKNKWNLDGDLCRWQREIPCVSFSHHWEDDFNGERVHRADDIPETLNLVTLYNSYRFIGSYLLGKGL